MKGKWIELVMDAYREEASTMGPGIYAFAQGICPDGVVVAGFVVGRNARGERAGASSEKGMGDGAGGSGEDEA